MSAHSEGHPGHRDTANPPGTRADASGCRGEYDLAASPDPGGGLRAPTCAGGEPNASRGASGKWHAGGQAIDMQPPFPRTRPAGFLAHFAGVGLVLSLGAARVSSAPVADCCTNLIGFSADHVTSQRELEAKFDALLDPRDLRSWLERMASAPNHVGSPHDKANAEFMLDLFREWGWDAHMETQSVLYPTPRRVALDVVAPKAFAARLVEPAVDGDRTSVQSRDALPPYHVYGADGDVTADVVYVNRGMPEDYKELRRRNITVNGRIVIARYGGGWRGLKPKLAFEHGAVACIVYSDPRDDGYGAGDIYPRGGFRPPDGVQRGSVLDMPVAPGDPLTPGVGATSEAKRLSVQEARTVLKIPVLPISYADAQPLLEGLEGPVAPEDWRGGLPITYHIGPGPTRAHLVIQSDWGLKTLYSVIGMIRGSAEPDHWVVRGNHHDGWVFGAWDPLSANVALMAEAKAIGALVRGGWRPRRTLVYASWDGEEPGLLGSTEWVETHADELRRKAVIYVNSDSNGRGFLGAAGSHSLQTLVQEVAAGIQDPETGVSVLARWKAKEAVDGYRPGAGAEDKEEARRIQDGDNPPIGALGSGSDYTPFLQHLGIASLDVRYGGENKDGGIYHSLYDSFDHFLRFGDPEFRYGITLATTIGHVVLRTADADVLPLRFSDFAEAVGRYVEQVHKLGDELRERAHRLRRLLDSKAYELAADPTEPVGPPERESDVPYLNFAPLDNALVRLRKSARDCDAACAKIPGENHPTSDAPWASVNDQMQGLEQALIYSNGLPGREWYKHMIYAPGLKTGYGVKTLPGIREALEDRDWSGAERYIGVTADVLNAYSERLEGITRVIRKP